MTTHPERFGVGAPLAASVAISMLAVGLSTSPVQAASVKSIQTEAKFISYDPDTRTIEIKVLKPGKRPKNKKLKLSRGKPATFKVNPEGSVLVRTSVTANGKRSSLEEIPDGKTLNVYWIPDKDDPDARYAKKIDMIWTDEELEARDKQRLEEARQKGQVEEE
jgi:hypothetical protein